MTIEQWELLSYIVTVIGLPFAITVFMLEQRKERENEEAEIYQKLSDDYAGFSKLLLEHADLRLMSEEIPDHKLTEEQRERKKVIFDILISLFERAFILVYQTSMNKRARRLWMTWADFIESWCKRSDFRAALPELLQGEDPEFGDYIRHAARSAEQGSFPKGNGNGRRSPTENSVRSEATPQKRKT